MIISFATIHIYGLKKPLGLTQTFCYEVNKEMYHFLVTANYCVTLAEPFTIRWITTLTGCGYLGRIKKASGSQETSLLHPELPQTLSSFLLGKATLRELKTLALNEGLANTRRKTLEKKNGC